MCVVTWILSKRWDEVDLAYCVYEVDSSTDSDQPYKISKMILKLR